MDNYIYSKFLPTLNLFLNKNKLNSSENANMVVLLQKKKSSALMCLEEASSVTVRWNRSLSCNWDCSCRMLYCWEKKNNNRCLSPLPHTHINMHLHGFTCAQVLVYMPTYLKFLWHVCVWSVCLHLHDCVCTCACGGADTWLYSSSALTIHSLFHLEQKLCWRTQKARFKSTAGVESPALDTWNNQCKLVHS